MSTISETERLRTEKLLAAFLEPPPPNKEVEDYLLGELGLGQDVLRVICKRRPMILQSDVRLIQYQVDFFKEKGFTRSEIAKMYTAHPVIFNAFLDKRAETGFETLQRLFGPTMSQKIVRKFPPLVLLDIARCIDRLRELLYRYEFTEEEIRKAIELSPSLLGCTSQNLAVKLAYLNEAGLGKSEIKQIIGKQPSALGLSFLNIKAKMEYFKTLLKRLGLPDSALIQLISSNPVLLSFSFEQRLIPRGELALSTTAVRTWDERKLATFFVMSEVKFDKLRRAEKNKKTGE